MIIGGETAAGKTVALRALAAEIPREERLITIERALELGLEDDEEAHPDIVPMEERLPNAEGEGAVTMRDLLIVTKRLRPDRVIVGEVLGDEILVMLNAMMNGNDGSLSTIHANSSEGVVENIVSYAIQAPERLPRTGAISMIANGLDFLVFVKRFRSNGQQCRVVHSVREIVGYDGEVLKTNEIFKPGADGMAVRDLPVGIHRIQRLREAGYRDLGEQGRWA
jgi:Flp pilus assembly CpaF family ATPase